MMALELVLHPIGTSECIVMHTVWDYIYHSNDVILVSIIYSRIPSYFYVLSRDHLPRLDPVAIKSSIDLPFKYDLTICGSSVDGMIDSLDSTNELQVDIPDESK